MKRREFLKRVAATGVSLAVSPLIFYPDPKIDNCFMSLEWLQLSYWNLVFGNEHPTLICMSVKRFDEIVSRIPPIQRYVSYSRDFASMRFERADMAPLPNIADGVVFFINESRPRDVRFSRACRVGEVWWGDAKGHAVRGRMEMVD